LAGSFVTSKDPIGLAAWYRGVLGIALEPWGGAILRYNAPGHPPMALWNAVPQGGDEIAPSNRDFMINFAVDDLDAFVARLEARGVKILKRVDDKTGKFASILDPRSGRDKDRALAARGAVGRTRSTEHAFRLERPGQTAGGS
jgi:predicted enzyme related to lactoylglutathione lyase